jgi:hypothetical protein
MPHTLIVWLFVAALIGSLSTTGPPDVRGGPGLPRLRRPGRRRLDAHPLRRAG